MSMDLETIKTREQAATPGPWIYKRREVSTPPDPHYASASKAYPPFHCYGGNRVGDAEFIAHAREDIPALIAEVERLRGMLADAERHVEHLEDIIIANDR